MPSFMPIRVKGGRRLEFGGEKQAIMTKNELLLLYNEEAQSLAYQQRLEAV